MLLLLASLLSPSARAAEPTLTLGPVVALQTRAEVPTDGLSVAACAAAPTPPTEPRTGTLVFEVQLRRGRVSLVSVMSTDVGLSAYEACLQRVLADYAWPVKSATVRVPVTVAQPPAAGPVTEAAPAATTEGAAATPATPAPATPAPAAPAPAAPAAPAPAAPAAPAP